MHPHNQTIGEVSSPVVRRWTAEDLPAIQHVYLTTWLDAYTAFIPESDLRAYFDAHYNLVELRALYEKPESSGYVAVIEGSVVGFVRTMFDRGEGRFYVSSLYILPTHQGRGVGMRLMKAAEREAARQNVGEIWLGVMKQNVKTLEWYRAQGFTFVKEEPFTMGNTTVSHLIGFKKL